MNTSRVIAYALCGCPDHHHDLAEHDGWKPTAEEAWDGRHYMGGQNLHLLRETVTTDIESIIYPARPTHDAPVGEVPPMLGDLRARLAYAFGIGDAA
jgi:hypothetical protein